MLKQRKTLTEPEVRFFLTQLVSGTRYIHAQRIIHRDLKLGNMLLNDAMHVKIADFGLATRLEYVRLCGTSVRFFVQFCEARGEGLKGILDDG